MVFKFSLFLKELILFSLTLFLGIFAVKNYIPVTEEIVLKPPSFSWGNVVVAIIFVIVFILLSLKFKRLNSIFFKFFLALLVFSGSQIIAGAIFASPWDLIAIGIITVLFLMVHNVFIHNLGIVIGIAGISSTLGRAISPEIGIGLLVILSFYDILAVYWTKHMVSMAKGMIESGAIFGFVVPFEWKDLFYHKHEARQKIGEKFMILGSGDVGLPAILVSSIAIISVQQAVITSLFAFGGLFLTHIIFINQGARRPMAALPPIATLTIIGYLVSQLL